MLKISALQSTFMEQIFLYIDDIIMNLYFTYKSYTQSIPEIGNSNYEEMVPCLCEISIKFALTQEMLVLKLFENIISSNEKIFLLKSFTGN